MMNLHTEILVIGDLIVPTTYFPSKWREIKSDSKMTTLVLPACCQIWNLNLFLFLFGSVVWLIIPSIPAVHCAIWSVLYQNLLDQAVAIPMKVISTAKIESFYEATWLSCNNMKKMHLEIQKWEYMNPEAGLSDTS